MSAPPDRHAATQAAFHAALWSPAPPPGLTARDPAEVPRRFAVYRNNVRHGLIEALRRGFPAVERLVGVEFFAAMAGVFASAHPPRSPVLHDWGAELPDFLAGFPPAAGLVWLPDVARLERLRAEAVHAADAEPLAPESLSRASPDRLRLRLHPSVGLFASAHPSLSIWRANRPDARGGAPGAKGPEWALIGRRPDFEVVAEPLSPVAHAVLGALAAGACLGRAAEAGDPTQALALLIRHGLIADVREGDAP